MIEFIYALPFALALTGLVVQNLAKDMPSPSMREPIGPHKGETIIKKTHVSKLGITSTSYEY